MAQPKAGEKPPPPPIEIIAAPADAYPRIAAPLRGHDVNLETSAVANFDREDQAVVFPAGIGQPITFKLALTANDADHKVRIIGAITDYTGRQLQTMDTELTAAKGQSSAADFTIKPTEQDIGPFYLAGTWQETNGPLKGEFYATAGQANWKLVVEDFELMRYPKPDQPLHNTPAAKHRGAQGLAVRVVLPPVPPNAPPHRPRGPEDKPPVPTAQVPLDLDLPGRPVALGFWIKCDKPLTVTLNLRDRGVEARQSRFFDAWTIGPIAVPAAGAGDWQYVRIPMPGYGRPKAKIAPYGESKGIVDYPLHAVDLQFACDSETILLVDDLETWSQGEKENSLFMRAVSSKPTGLLYRNDTLNLAIANAWLWGEAITVGFNASLEDAHKRQWPLASGNATIKPGDEHVQAAPIKDLPLGPYQLTAEARLGDGPAVQPSGKSRFIVYEPGGKTPDPAALDELLGNRHQLLRELGYTQDELMVNWHSVDGAPSVEPVPGIWTFDFINPEIAARKKAGLELLGTLGLCALWADPGAVFNPYTTAWNGSVYVMPSRPVYWEEYVRRTMEQYKGTIDTWIVWDRPDSDLFAASAQEYAEQMLEVTHKAAKEVGGDIRLISGGIGRENIEKYLVGLSEAGAHHYLHGIGILPSTSPLSPEDGYMDVILGRAQRIRHQEQIRPEFWVLGLGWPTGEGQYDVSEIDQAFYLARAFIICRSQGITNIFLKPDRTQVSPRRNSADLVYPEGPLTGIKPAALAGKVVRQFMLGSEFLREIVLQDRTDAIARAFLFKQPDGKLLLVAWRREGQSTLPVPTTPLSVTDAFGNAIDLGGKLELALSEAPIYALFESPDPAALARQIERTPLRFEDAPESAWKGQFTFHLDVGNEADEKAAGYQASNSRLVGPIDSYYHNEYGRHAVDSGRHFARAGSRGGEESFTVDVSGFGEADMVVRKRLNYAIPNQIVKVYCNDQEVGQWLAFKRDRRYRWRDAEFVIPNRFLKGQLTVRLRFVNIGKDESTSFYYWVGPVRNKTMYLSDMSLLVNTSGYGPGTNRDKNILGGPISFYDKTADAGGPTTRKTGGKVFDKGIGTNAAPKLPESLIVVPLNKQFMRFKATIGVDAATNGRGSVRFRIGDGTKTLYDSQDMNYYSEPREIDIDVSESILLMLSVDDTGDGHQNDIANWANARLELK